MAVQQRRVTSSRKKMRRSHHGLKAPNLSSCDKCGHKKVQHRVCLNCGFYNNKKVINTENI